METTMELRNDTIDVKPVDFNFGEGYTETWEYLESCECPECGAIVTGRDECPNEECDCEYAGESNEGPMMNYYYPLPKLYKPTEDDAEKLVNLPLCLVIFLDDDTWALALTGGGMDLSWEICAGFIALGFLPPVHFSRLPNMAGMKATERNMEIVAACKRSAEIEINWANSTIRDLENTEEYLKGN